MNTAIINHHFKLINDSLKYKTVRHYQAINEMPKGSILAEVVKVSVNRNFNYSKGATHLFYLKKGGKWQTTILTGLYPAQKGNIYFGDIIYYENRRKKKHLVIFIFNKDRTSLKVDVYLKCHPTKEALNRVLSKY